MLMCSRCSANETAVTLRHTAPHATADGDCCLVFAGKCMVPDVSLEEYGLQEGSTIHVLGRLRGGAQLGKVVKGRSQVKKKDGKSKDFGDLQAKYNKMQELDAARLAAQAARMELQRRMEAEERNSRTNRLKIQNQWRKIMRLAKVESLRRDIEILSQNHERDVDRKDAIIQMLDRDLEEAEDQYQTALRAHLHGMDGLIDLQDARLLSLERHFEAELVSMEGGFREERARVAARHASETAELRDVVAVVDAREAERDAEARAEHEQLREEIRNRNLEDINVLRITLDTQIEELEQHFETAHINYLQNTDQRTTDFKYLTAKDQELSREIELKVRKIERLQNALAHWRTKIAQSAREAAERNRLLTEERGAVQGHFQRLRARMGAYREAQGQRLLELTRDARAAKGKLQEQLDLAERVLKLAELARKAETEAEKISPYYPSPHTDAVEREEALAADAERRDGDSVGGSSVRMEAGVLVRVAGGGDGGGGGDAAAAAAAADGVDEGPPPGPAQASARDAATGRAVARHAHLDNFNKKYNAALLDALAAEREEARLARENAGLRALVKQYLAGIGAGPDVVEGPNPLLVVNGRVNIVRRAPPVARPPPAIDAVHMVATGRVSTRLPL
ncbi:flagellar associated protein [Tribonema minus]|uniref:Dynein regulatory complex subunit 2 n=1 Tax=Tribonema minus TaxID=303371 RepID=A0A835ZEY8_9STRA|nr:flagellar associated protein [Tribonema minus]